MARTGALGVEDVIRNKVNKIRHWKLTSLGKKHPKWGFEFTVMTYNILSQDALDCHLYLYRKCNPHYLSQEYRISRLLPEILKSKSDVICLQEVDQYVFHERMKKVFNSNGFGYIFKKRTGNKSDGCAILWKRAKFSLIKHQAIEYRIKSSKCLDRDNIGLIAVLRPLHPEATETKLNVATTHLIFNPRRGDVKLCQLRLFLAELERMAFKEVTDNGRVYHPTILCGDFNFQPHSPLYKFIDTGRLDVTGLIAGNMSGQHEGKDKGGYVNGEMLSLNRLGIDESGRFTVGNSSANSQERYCHKKPETDSNSSNEDKKGESSNNSRLDSYRLLNDMMHVNPSKSEPSTSSSESSSDSETPAQLFYHDFNFVPTYKYYNQNSKNLPITSMIGGDCNNVDHIFYTVKEKSATSFVEDSLKLLGVYSLPYAEDVRDMDGLPNAHLGSDHLSLMSKFIISFK